MVCDAEREKESDPVLWMGLAGCGGALATVAPMSTALALVAIAFAIRRRLGHAALILAVLSFAIGCARAQRVVAHYERERSAVVDFGGWPARCSARGTVVRSPTRLGAGLRLEIDAAEIRCRDGPPLHGRLTVYLPLDEPMAHRPIARGDVVDIFASLAPPYRFWNDGAGDPRPGSARRGALLTGGAEDLVIVREGRGIGTAIDRARAHARERILATFPSGTAAMARALVLGEDDLAEGDARAFRRSGLAHLLAVSGAHLVLVVLGLVAVLRALLARVPPLAARCDVMRLASLVALPLTWIYAEFAGGSGSAIRAAWMCSVALLARVLDARSSAWRALGFSLMAMTAVDPLVVFDISFVLSALATSGILGLSRPFEAAFARHWSGPVGERVTKPLATTLAATVACAPAMALLAPEVSLSGLLANVIAVPVGEAAALPLCLLHGVLAAWPAAEQGCAAAASGALVLVRHIAHAFTWGALPVPSPTASELAAIAFGAAARGRAAWCAAVAVVVLEIATRIQGAPKNVLRVTFIDVGQGDSALVDLPDGAAILIDGGGLVGSPIDVGERAVLPLLAARRRGNLEAIVLSHPHPDHYLGLPTVLTRVPARALWDTGDGDHHAPLLASVRAHGVPILRPVDLCGVREIGGATIEVLAPCPGPLPDRGANDNSFVIRIRYGKRAILFTGDAEHEAEDGLLRLGPDSLRADVLKVGHHGSRTSSTAAFVAAVAPEVAVVSCGVRNRFGHPHPSTLATFAAAGVRLFRTDRDGSVVVTTNGATLDVGSTSAR